MKLYGKNPSLERLRIHPQTVRKIIMQQGFEDAAFVLRKAKSLGIPVVSFTRDYLDKIARNLNHQGIILEVDEFSYVQYDDLLEKAIEKRRVILYLDNLTDPQNLGAIIRSLGNLGHFSIVIPTHDAVGVTDTVLRIASGGENHVDIAKVANINKAIRLAKEEGFQIIGAVVRDGESIYDAKFHFPLGVVIGSEDKGIRPVILNELDRKITIPMHAETISFNVAHAATIFCYEITRQIKTR